MSNYPIADIRLRRFGVTRSLQDRLFLFLIGALQVAFALFFLAPFFMERATGTSEVSLRIALTLWFELLLAVLALGICCLIWGVAAPRWLESAFSNILGHFWIVLMIAFLLSLIAFGLVFVFRV